MYDQSKVISCQITTPGCSTTYTLTRPSLTIASGVTATKNGGATVTAASNWSASITSVTGTPYPSSTISYQWKFDGTNFSSGGTTSSVSFASFYSDSGKTVRCAVTHTDTSGSGQSTTTNFDYTMTVNRGTYGAYGGSVSTGALSFDREIFPTPGQWGEIISYTVPSSWWSVNSISGTISTKVINNDGGAPTNETYNTSSRTTYYWTEATNSQQYSTYTTTTNYRVNNVTDWSSYASLYGDSINGSYTPQNRTIRIAVEINRSSDANKSLQGRGNYTINGTLAAYQNDTRSSNP